MSITEHMPSRVTPRAGAGNSGLQGKRAAMVVYSSYPSDPRPRRAAEALLKEGMSVDLICLGDEKQPRHEVLGNLDVLRIPITHRRGGKLSYAYKYFSFIFISAILLAFRCLKRRYHLVHVHNMPDVLVLSAMVPKLLGARVILDLHDPMPELMTTIYELDKNRRSVRVIRWLEKWSIARADLVLTVNIACKRIFGTRSCDPAKIGVVMNSPDEDIFPFRESRSRAARTEAGAAPFVIMYHGSLVERNGLDLAVEALARLRERVPAAELNIYGSKTPFLERVLDEAREKGIADRVHFQGRRSLEDLVGAIDACDLGVIPNQRNEFTDINTPTRIFEYLTLGKPVIAPRTPGIQDYFGQDSLFFFESGNAEELAQQIEYVATHPREVAETVERGQQVYLAHRWWDERQTFVNLVSGLVTKAKRYSVRST